MTFTVSEKDRLLRGRDFHIHKPQDLPRLLHTPPADLTGFEVEFEYDETPKDVPSHMRGKETKVGCIQCKKAANHWKGFVFKNSDNQRMLIGKDCGERHYGAHYEDIQRDFEGAKIRQHDLNVVVRSYPILPRLSEELTAVADHLSYKQLDQAQSNLKINMLGIFQRLTSAARTGRMVIVRDQIPNEEAMSQRRARNANVRAKLDSLSKSEKRRLEAIGELPELEDESTPLLKTVEIGAFPLKGSELFNSRTIGIHREMIHGVARLAKVFYDHLQNQTSDNLTSKELSTERAKLEDMARQVLTAMEEIAAMAQFFEQDHLAQVAAWANGFDGDGARYEARARSLVRREAAQTVVIGLPPNYALPDDSFIRDFGKEVNASIKALAA